MITPSSFPWHWLCSTKDLLRTHSADSLGNPSVSFHTFVPCLLSILYINPRVLLGISPVRTQLNTSSSPSNLSSRLQRPLRWSTPSSPDRIPTSASLFPSILTLASKYHSAIDKFVQLLSQHFECHDLGPTRFLLGVSVERDRSTCYINTNSFWIFWKNMVWVTANQSKLHCLPNLSHPMSSSTQEEKDLMTEVSYLSAVGSLQYLAIMTTPDISHSVAYLACFNSNPGSRKLAGVRVELDVFRWALKVTKEIGRWNQCIQVSSNPIFQVVLSMSPVGLL